MTGYTGSCEDFVEALLAEIGTAYDFGFGTQILKPRNVFETLCMR